MKTALEEAQVTMLAWKNSAATLIAATDEQKKDQDPPRFPEVPAEVLIQVKACQNLMKDIRQQIASQLTEVNAAKAKAKPKAKCGAKKAAKAKAK